MDKYGHSSGHQHHPDGKEIHRNSAFPERMEETWTDLQTYGKDKENEAEILDERQSRRIRPESEVAEYDSDEEYPGRTYRYSFYFETPQEKSKGDNDCKEQYGMGYACTGKEIRHATTRIRNGYQRGSSRDGC